MMVMTKKISVVIPCFNEEGNICVIVEALHKVFKTTIYDYELIFVDDGSTDKTIYNLRQLSKTNNKIFYVELSRNFGKDSALKAGLDIARGDAVITMDADMQHPPELILELIKNWENGYEIVFAHRKGANPHASFFNKLYSGIFWYILTWLSEMPIENGISDYRILDRKVVDVLKPMYEFELFLRGMVKWIGYRQYGIEYVPNERLTGDTTYSNKALIKLAIHGITSFSVRPLYTAIYLGFVFSALALLYIPYILYSYYVHASVPGWGSVIFTIVFFGGLNLIMLGVIGIYVGKIFMQTKNRPNYLIRKTNLNINS